MGSFRSFGDLTAALTAVGLNPSTMIEWIQVSSAYGPTYTMQNPLVTSGTPSTLPGYLQALQPAMLVKVAGLDQPISIAPAGNPPPTKWPIVSVGILAGGALGLGLLLNGLLHTVLPRRG